MTEDKRPKPTCFVIQSFDGGTYDRRYRETIKPALLKAEVEPQRADEILGLNPVIDKIETAIESASICIAEVSEDNPNVWLELGYALALDRPTVILCDKSKREKLPFDIQHRPIIFYRTDSRSGYEELESSIVKWIRNELDSSKRISNIRMLKPGSEKATDFEDYEVAILSLAFAFWPTTSGSIGHWQLEQKLKEMNFTEIALALGVSGLVEKGYLNEKLLIDTDYNNEEYKAYSVTNAAIKWLQENKNLLEVKKQVISDDYYDKDIPF
ncbi:hypothetical protein E8Q33_11765 [Methylophaga sp. SB9B]|uniref:hypothetical protein n=1 Tax=Methylophaga sp. SB9B TaxID=2570356 RepID=UPI0010A8B8D1|nr:hypothetical protein [Methylophaga sp. SB9B]THK40733.1 hypothetical protein E8Q33_11765 [Methylophaga sp. SB9B]